jgi:hypothetical protein
MWKTLEETEMQLSPKQKIRSLVGATLIASMAMIGVANAAVPMNPPGVPIPSLPEPDPTAPPLPGGGG